MAKDRKNMGGPTQGANDTPTADRWEATFKAEGIDPRLLDAGGGVA